MQTDWEERKAGIKRALEGALRIEGVLEKYAGEPMYEEVLEDMRVERERGERHESTKNIKRRLRNMVESALKVREDLAGIRGKSTSWAVYLEAWDSVTKGKGWTDTAFEARLPGADYNDAALAIRCQMSQAGAWETGKMAGKCKDEKKRDDEGVPDADEDDDETRRKPY